MSRLAKVFVQGREFNKQTAQTFLKQDNYIITDSIKNSDIVVWTGGEDINPELYGETRLECTFYTERDIDDLQAVEEAYKLDKFMVGICRGAQLLNVIPNGGKLWQDVNHHGGRIHKAMDCLTGQWVNLNSVHHQALRVTEEAEIIAWAEESTFKQSDGIRWFKKDGYQTERDRDIEAVWYPKTRSLLFQGHPEFGHPPTTQYFFTLMDKYYWGI